MKLSLNLQINKPSFQLNVNQDIHWEKPGIHVIFGESGCGKSHLLRSICGLEKISGRIEFNDHVWQHDAAPSKSISSKKITPTHKRNVSMVFQDGQLFSHLNVLENLMFSFKRSNCSQDEFDLCVNQLQIQHLLKHDVNDLSGGERQRVAIARSLLSKPDLLLMDEPLASLDWKSKSEILPFIQQLSTVWNLPILYVTHSIDEVMELADHVILLEKKQGMAKVVRSAALMDVLSDINNPFNQHPNASSILLGNVKHEGYQQDGLHKVSLAEQFLYLTNANLNQLSGSQVRLNIHASDVSISLSHAMDSSILNILHGKIVEIKHEPSGHCLIQLEVDGQIILSRISTYSAQRLNLKLGMSVFAQIKAVALSK